MSLFTKYRPLGYKFLEPERLSTAEASLRRTQAMLREHERAWKADLRLSPVTKKILEEEARGFVKGRTRPTRPALTAAALAKFTEADFADPQKRLAYRELRKSQGGQQKVTPPGSSKRYYNPTGKDFASTIYGNIARFTFQDQLKRDIRSMNVPRFANPAITVPCVQRYVRQQVMFAKGFAGRGYHTKKRRSWSSGVPC